MSIYTVKTAGHSLIPEDLLFGGEYFACHGRGAQYRFKACRSTGEELGNRNLPVDWLLSNVSILVNEPERDTDDEKELVRRLAARARLWHVREGPEVKPVAALKAAPVASHKAFITPSQALLVMMDVAADGTLPQLYFNGLSMEALERLLKKYGHHLAEKKLEVSTNPELINNDETKRYFETHLCFATLRAFLGAIDLDFLNLMYARALALAPVDYAVRKGEEFYDLGVTGITPTTRTGLSSEEQRKSKRLCAIAGVAVAIAKANTVPMPLDIYGTSPIFQDAYRGRLPWPDHKAKSASSDRLGIMRADMPLPRRDVARAAAKSTYKRPADNSTLRPDAKFPQLLHSQLVLPFSNSPSGTMLCLIRLLLHLEYFEGAVDLAFWRNYFRCSVAALLYGSGGHTIHEFLVPFELQEVRTATTLTGMDAVALFYDQNNGAMSKALSAARFYNRKIIRLKRVVGVLVGKMLPAVQSKLAQARRRKAEDDEKRVSAASAAAAQRRFVFKIDDAIAASKTLAARAKLEAVKALLESRGWLAELKATVYPAAGARIAVNAILASHPAMKAALLETLDMGQPALLSLLDGCLSKA